jgi:hypothetical protein
MFSDWIIDVTRWPNYCFVPYINGNIVFGMNLITDTCPGNLVGFIHLDGNIAAQQWENKNPDWHKKYSSPKQETA